MSNPKRKEIFDTVVNDDEQALENLIGEKAVLLRTTNSDKQTVAHIAFNNGKTRMLKYLLKKDEYLITAADKWGQTVLHLASHKGDLETLKFLVEECKIGVTDHKNRFKGNTAVHIAAHEGHLSVLKYFFEEHDPKCNVNIRNDEGETPLISAAKKPHLNVVKYLVEDLSANATLVDHYDASILYQSARTGDLSVPKYLMDEKKIYFDVDWRNIFDMTVIFMAARFNQLDFIKYMVEEKGATIDIPNNQNYTPLHEAAEEGHLEVVKYLVSKKASIGHREIHGKKPVDLTKNQHIIEYLKDAELQRQKDGIKKQSRRSRRNVNELSVRHSVHPQTPIPCKWIQKMITEHSWSSARLDGRDDNLADGMGSLQLDSFLTLAGACARYATGVGVQQPKPQSLLSPKEIVQERMDPIAFDALDVMYDFEYPHIN